MKNEKKNHCFAVKSIFLISLTKQIICIALISRQTVLLRVLI